MLKLILQLGSQKKNNINPIIINEKHVMRYFFAEEISKFALENNFKMMSIYSWLSKRPAGINDWYGVAILKLNHK